MIIGNDIKNGKAFAQLTIGQALSSTIKRHLTFGDFILIGCRII